MAILAERIFLFARERLIEQRGFIRDPHTWRPGPNVCLLRFREPIITFATGACTDPLSLFVLSSNPFSLPFPSTESNTFLLFAFRPALFCTASLDPRFPSISSIFIPRNPRFFSPFTYPLSNVLLPFFFFFFKTRDDEICLPHSFLFYLLNFVFLVEFKFHLHHGITREIASKSCLC